MRTNNRKKKFFFRPVLSTCTIPFEHVVSCSVDSFYNFLYLMFCTASGKVYDGVYPLDRAKETEHESNISSIDSKQLYSNYVLAFGTHTQKCNQVKTCVLHGIVYVLSPWLYKQELHVEKIIYKSYSRRPRVWRALISNSSCLWLVRFVGSYAWSKTSSGF